MNFLAVKYSKLSSRKRIAVPFTEKKRYAEMIMKRASRSTISDLYRKKYKSELPETTFFRWKREAKSVVEVLLIGEGRGRGAYRALFRSSN